MVLNTHRFKLACSLALFIITQPVFATLEAVKIQSDTAKFDQNSGLATYEGHVELTQANHLLNADNLIVYKDKKGSVERIVARGNPATFKGTLPDEIDPVHAQASEIVYYPQNSLLKLSENAKIRFKNDTFNGPLLEYHVQKQLIVATSANKQRPIITLENPKFSEYGK